MPRHTSRSFKTPLDYKPKHRTPDGWAGSTPRGPHRWARAAHNALTRPNSQAAMLYLDRVTLAHQVRKDFASTRSPIVFFEYTSRWDPIERRSEVDTVSHERRYITCSLFCAAMQVQLDFSEVKTYQQLVDFLTFDFRTNLLRNTEDKLTRTVGCQYCGTRIRP